jgi:hypothetical protein
MLLQHREVGDAAVVDIQVGKCEERPRAYVMLKNNALGITEKTMHRNRYFLGCPSISG